MIENNMVNRVKLASKVVSLMSEEEKEDFIFDYLLEQYRGCDFGFQDE